MSAIPLRRIEGKYEILEKIREGGMGAIYKVRHRLLDEIRVIKLMRPQLIGDEELRARFVREAQVAIKLRHPNIAHLYDFTADEDGTAFIVMEYIRGKTLEELLKTAGPPPLGLTLEMAQQSLRAIGYLHQKGFVHRDISPDNLMLTEDPDGNPQIKLIDLGIAKILGGPEVQLTQAGAFLGKVRYASPEQFGSEGVPTADASGDLYSFGVVLYELLTGTYPISGRDPSSIIAGHLFRPPISFDETDREHRLSAGLRAVILKALAKKSSDRPASAQEFARELSTFRTPGDIDPNWKEILEQSIPGSARVTVDPGSTQDRLDERFVLGATPPPPPTAKSKRSSLLAPVASSAPAAAPVDEALHEARELLARQDPAAAIARLLQVQSQAPKHPEVAALLREAEAQNERQAEQRRQAIDAAVGGIKEALNRGDLRAAEAQLYTAEAAFGEQAVFQSLHARLAAQRRQDLAAQVARLVDNAHRHLAIEDFGNAVSELKQALHLDPSRQELNAEISAAETALRRQTAARERQAAIDDTAAEIESLLQGGEHAEAGKRLGRARTEHPHERVFVELGERLKTEEERLRESELLSLLEEVRHAAAAESWKQADKLLRHAREIAPKDLRVQQLQTEVTEAFREIEEAKRRTLEIDRKAAEIGKRLDRNQLDEAAQLLEAVARTLGETDAWAALRNRLAELRDRARDTQIKTLLDAARRHASRQNHPAALASARQALILDPQHRDAVALVSELEAETARREREQQQAAAVASAAREVTQRLEKGDVEGASTSLDRAVAELGDASEWTDLRKGIERRRQEARAARVGELVAAARRHQNARDHTQALAALREASSVDPDHPEVRRLIQDIETTREGEARQAAELAQAQAAVARHLERGELDAGAALLESSQRLGTADSWRELGDRLGALRRAALAAKIATHLSAARKAAAAAAFTEALAEARNAAALDPRHREASGLVQEYEAALVRQEADRKRGAAVGQAAAEIATQLERGNLDAASQLLAATRSRLGDTAQLAELETVLRSRRDEESARAAQIAALLESAGRHLSADNLTAVGESLRQAQAIDPAHSGARDLEAQLEAARGRQARERQQAEDLAATAETVRGCLDRGELDQAAQHLDRAVVRFGAVPALREHWARLEELRRSALDDHLARVILAARTSLSAGDFAKAKESLDEARTLKADAPELKALADDIAAAEKETAEKARKAAALAELGRSAGQLLDRGETAKAGELLATAAADHPEAASIKQLRARHKSLERVDELLQEARLVLSADNTADALRRVEQALKLVPGHTPARALQTEIKQRQAAAQRAKKQRPVHAPAPAAPPKPAPPPASAAIVSETDRTVVQPVIQNLTPKPATSPAAVPAATRDEQILAGVERISTRLASGQPKEALQDLRALTETFGERPEFVPLRKKIADALLPADTAPIPVSTLRPPTPSPPAPRPATRAELPKPVPAAPLPASVAAPAPTATASNRMPLVLGIIVAVVLLAALGWYLTHRTPSAVTQTTAAPQPEPVGASGSSGPSGPATVATGQLVIDALPWGELVAIHDEHGTVVPLPASTTTPLTLSLPAGRYSVELRNPNAPHTVVQRVEVSAAPGAPAARLVAEFHTADADDFLKGMGW